MTGTDTASQIAYLARVLKAPALRESADHDLYLRLASTHRVRRHGDVVAEYRRHGGNMTRNPRANLRERIDVTMTPMGR